MVRRRCYWRVQWEVWVGIRATGVSARRSFTKTDFFVVRWTSANPAYTPTPTFNYDFATMGRFLLFFSLERVVDTTNE